MEREEDVFRRPSSNSGSGMVEGNNNNSNNIVPAATATTLREQDQYMPIANVIRIMRRILPPHAKISDDAKETIQECVSEYISFITGEANDRCQREQRKTITADDVLWAMGKLGFDDYVQPLTLFLSRYRELENSSIRSDPFMRRPVAEYFGSLGGLGPPPFNFSTAHQQPGVFNPLGGYVTGSSSAQQGGGMGNFDSYQFK